MLRILTTAALVTLLLSTGLEAQAEPPTPEAPVTVTTDNETPVLYDDDEGGNASGDDPAIWVHPGDSDRSIVIVTAKEGGLRVYDLDGARAPVVAGHSGAARRRRRRPVQQRRHRLRAQPRRRARRRGRGLGPLQRQLRFFVIDPAGADAATPLTEVTAPGQEYLFHPDRDGVDRSTRRTGSRSGSHARVRRTPWSPRRARPRSRPRGSSWATPASATTASAHLDLPGEFPLPDGVDLGALRGAGRAAPARGSHRRPGRRHAVRRAGGRRPLAARAAARARRVPCWWTAPRTSASTTSTTRSRRSAYRSTPSDEGFGGRWLTADAEGVDLYYGRGNQGYVVVSSQGDDTYVVYRRQGDNRVARHLPRRRGRCGRRERVRRAGHHEPSRRPLRHGPAGHPRRAGDRRRARSGARRDQLLLRRTGARSPTHSDWWSTPGRPTTRACADARAPARLARWRRTR